MSGTIVMQPRRPLRESARGGPRIGAPETAVVQRYRQLLVRKVDADKTTAALTTTVSAAIAAKNTGKAPNVA